MNLKDGIFFANFQAKLSTCFIVTKRQIEILAKKTLFFICFGDCIQELIKCYSSRGMSSLQDMGDEWDQLWWVITCLQFTVPLHLMVVGAAHMTFQ